MTLLGGPAAPAIIVDGLPSRRPAAVALCHDSDPHPAIACWDRRAGAGLTLLMVCCAEHRPRMSGQLIVIRGPRMDFSVAVSCDCWPWFRRLEHPMPNLARLYQRS